MRFPLAASLDSSSAASWFSAITSELPECLDQVIVMGSNVPLSAAGLSLNKACNSATFSSRCRVYETAEVRPAELPKVHETPLDIHLSQGWVPVHFTFRRLQASQAEDTFALANSPEGWPRRPELSFEDSPLEDGISRKCRVTMDEMTVYLPGM